MYMHVNIQQTEIQFIKLIDCLQPDWMIEQTVIQNTRHIHTKPLCKHIH